MKTPYDTLLRVQQRTLDRLRVAIASEAATRAGLVRQRDAIDDAVAAARRSVHADALLPTDAFVRHARVRRTAVAQDHLASDRRLGALQGRSTATFGAMEATRLAIDQFHAEGARILVKAEDGLATDIAAARLARRPQRAPAARA